MYIVKLKMGYNYFYFKYAIWDECAYIIKSLTEHNANEEFCIEVTWEPEKTKTVYHGTEGEVIEIADE